MGNETTNIGGITFRADDVLSTSSKRYGTYNMKPLFEYTVKTKYGTFKFQDQESCGLPNDNKQSTIFQKSNGQVVIDNCNLSIKGTDKTDNYVANDSYIGTLNTNGDYGSKDTLTLTGKSFLHTKSIDYDDKIVDLTSHGAPSDYIPIHYDK